MQEEQGEGEQAGKGGEEQTRADAEGGAASAAARQGDASGQIADRLRWGAPPTCCLTKACFITGSHGHVALQQLNPWKALAWSILAMLHSYSCRCVVWGKAWSMGHA